MQSTYESARADSNTASTIVANAAFILQALLEIQIEVYEDWMTGYTHKKYTRDVGIKELRTVPDEIRARIVACLRSGGEMGQYLDTPDFHTILEVLLALIEFDFQQYLLTVKPIY